MGSFIRLDGHELLDGELGVRESSLNKVAFFELGEGFGVKFGLELFQNVRKCWMIESMSAPRSDQSKT